MCASHVSLLTPFRGTEPVVPSVIPLCDGGEFFIVREILDVRAPSDSPDRHLSGLFIGKVALVLKIAGCLLVVLAFLLTLCTSGTDVATLGMVVPDLPTRLVLCSLMGATWWHPWRGDNVRICIFWFVVHICMSVSTPEVTPILLVFFKKLFLYCSFLCTRTRRELQAVTPAFWRTPALSCNIEARGPTPVVSLSVVSCYTALRACERDRLPWTCEAILITNIYDVPIVHTRIGKFSGPSSCNFLTSLGGFLYFDVHVLGGCVFASSAGCVETNIFTELHRAVFRFVFTVIA